MSPEPLSIAFPYDGAFYGGSYVSSLALARELAERGHRAVVCVHGDGRILEEAQATGLEIFRLPPLAPSKAYAHPGSAGLHHILGMADARRALERIRPTLLHLNDLSMLRLWAGPGHLSNAATVVHWRSNYTRSWSIDIALRAARLLIAVSHYSKQQLPAWVQRRTRVIYNPMNRRWSDAERMAARAEIRGRLDLPPNALLLGVFGSITARKRVWILPEVVHRLREGGLPHPVYGLVCGDPLPPIDHLFAEKTAAYGLQDRILQVGFVRPVEPWMAACDLVLMPARSEPFGRTPFEALATGTPVLLSQASGAAELIDEPLCLVSDPAPEAWASAVRRLLGTDPGRLIAAASPILETFTVRHHAAEVEAAYAAAIERASAA